MGLKPLDVSEVARNLMEMLRQLLGEHIDLRFETASVPLMVEANAGLLEQVLMNLCVNARDSMPGGGLIVITAALSAITDEQARTQRRKIGESVVCLAVRDEGCGMDQKVRERVFDSFFTTKAPGIGTGLGLSIVHGIIRQHRGWIEVESEPGQGSTFRIYLPVACSQPVDGIAPTIVDSPSPQKVSGNETILAVEDDPGLRGHLSKVLRVLGYSVLEAANGVEALELWPKERDRIALLFTDAVMPGGISGLELATRLQQEKQALKVILSSGYAPEARIWDNPDGLRLVFLPKPYEVATLGRTIRKCLG
jgi:CheY-like chemotaxis protein